MKYLMFVFFLAINIIGFCQENEDSAAVREEIRSDSLRKSFIGFSAGAHCAYPFISQKTNAAIVDSISNWQGKPYYGFVIGIQWLRKLNEQFYFQSGTRVYLSKLNSDFNQKTEKIDLSIPYSMVEIPINLCYIPNFSSSSFNTSIGFNYNLDITNKVDKDLRMIGLRSNNLVFNYSLGYTFVNELGTHFQTQLIASYGLINLLKPNRTDISSSLKSLNRSQIALVITVF